MSELNDMSIFRFHVRINGKRTTISLDPEIFRSLTFKLGSTSKAKEWITDKSSTLVKTNKSISRQLQSAISLLLADISPSPQQNSSSVNSIVQPSHSSSHSSLHPINPLFKSDDLPL